MSAQPQHGIPCPHLLVRPPDLLLDGSGEAYVLFHCVMCGLDICCKLGEQDQVIGAFAAKRDSRETSGTFNDCCENSGVILPASVNQSYSETTRRALLHHKSRHSN